MSLLRITHYALFSLMTVSLSVFLFVYLVYIAIFLFFTFFNLYHMTKYGFVSLTSYIVTVLYIIATALGLFVSYYLIAQIDWSNTFNLFSTSGMMF